MRIQHLTLWSGSLRAWARRGEPAPCLCADLLALPLVRCLESVLSCFQSKAPFPFVASNSSDLSSGKGSRGRVPYVAVRGAYGSRLNDVLATRVFRLVQLGMKLPEMSEALGRPMNTIWNWIKRLQLHAEWRKNVRICTTKVIRRRVRGTYTENEHDREIDPVRSMRWPHPKMGMRRPWDRLEWGIR